MASSPSFTCINCNVAFAHADVQRFHYKTDWHRYNLKRKVADLPPLSAEQFRSLVLQQQQEDTASSTSSLYCSPCRKPFRSQQQLHNHVKSRRHLETERRWLLNEQSRNDRHLVAELNTKNAELSGISEKETVSLSAGHPPRSRSPASQSNTSSSAAIDQGDDEMWEDVSTLAAESVASDGEELWTGCAIPPNACLFCPRSFTSMAASISHMTECHSFYVPDLEYVCDLEGLISYLGQKVGEGFICLWCNERGKHFYSIDSVQKHMRDKGHTKILHEGEVLLEYADYYDYSSTYPDDGDEEVEVDQPAVLDADAFQLVLPSGAVVGHRSLFRYYRQRLKPLTAQNTASAALVARHTLDKYRIIGCHANSKQQLQRTARDMRALRRYQQQSWTRIGVKANRLQKHFRQQCPY